jgi:phosphate transport system permease protein
MEPAAINLKARGRSRRRLLVNRVAEGLAVVAALLAIAVLGVVVWSVGSRGVGAIDLGFFIKGPSSDFFGGAGGGIAPALVGSLLLVAIATAIALPFGVLTAIYVSEFAPVRVAQQIRLWLDVLNGFPSIVIGIFVFTLCVKVKFLGIGGRQTAIAGGLALSVIMLPLVARSTMEVLRLVPDHLREASYALGVSKWQTVIRVVLPTSFGGILTGTTLAVARAAGETAPLLFTCAIAGQIVDWNPTHSVQSIPLTIFNYSESADPVLHQQAWAAAFVLIAFVLVTSLTARLLLERSRRRLGLQ